MSITNAELNALAARINNKLLKYRAQFIMSVHFSLDRINDIRNNPPITLNEYDTHQYALCRRKKIRCDTCDNAQKYCHYRDD